MIYWDIDRQNRAIVNAQVKMFDVKLRVITEQQYLLEMFGFTGFFLASM